MFIKKQKTPMILLIIKILSVLVLLTGTASATITLTDYNSRVALTNERISLSDLYDYILVEKGEEITHSTYMEEVSPGIWHVHAQIFSGSTINTNGTLIITSDDATHVYFTYVAGPGYYAYWAGADWKDVTISSWDTTTNTSNVEANTRMLFADNSRFDNVIWREAGQTLFGNNYYPRENIQVSDSTVTGWYTFTEFYGENFTIDNFTMVDSYPVWDINRAGIKDSILYNSTMKNVYINPFKTFDKLQDESTDSYGLQVGGNNNYYENIHVENTSYSGYNLNGYYNTYINLSSHNAAHNQIEGQARDSIYKGLRVTGGTSAYTDAAWFTSLDSAGANVTVTDLFVDNKGSGAGIRLLGETDSLDDFRFQNTTLLGSSIIVGNTKNLVFENLTLERGGHYLIWQFDNAINTTIINSDISSTTGGFYTMINSDVKIINSKFVDTSAGSYGIWSILSYYPMDVQVSNALSKSISDFELKFTSLAPTLNRGNDIYIADYIHDNNGYTYYNHAVDILDTINPAIDLDITPDSTWYREDPNTPTYTITAVIPDSTTGPHITGFAPSSDNPFTAGETKKFQVWADEELTTMKWYVNGNLRSSGSMTYDWTVETGSHTIMFAGSNSNGAVVQTWEVTEGEVPSTTPGSSGTGVTFTPSTTSLTATAGESTTFTADSTDELVSSSWSYDGVQVATGTSYVQNWDKVGTHTVEFLGTTTTETVTNTWTVEVSEQAVSEYSSISISASAPIVKPGESFTIDVYIDPTESITGSQFDLQYSQLASVTTVAEGDLFTQSGLSTMFEYEGLDNTLGVLTHVYSAIVGSGTVSTAGTMATITMTAGSESGILDLGLNNVIVSDANSAPAGYTVTNATVLVDTAPVFATTASQTVEEGQSLSFTVSATDAEADPLTYSATSLPSGASFDGQTFSWTPAEGDEGSYSAVFEVTDGYLSASMTVAVTVTPMNHAPVITLFEPADSAVFEEGSTINVNVIASDADGESLSYIIKIDGVQVTTASSYAWAVDYESAGTHTIEVIVSDGIDEVSSSSTITITDLQPRWDVNEDGVVNVLDITLIGQNYGATYTENPPRWDVNQDGIVNIQDLSIVSGHFGETI